MSVERSFGWKTWRSSTPLISSSTASSSALPSSWFASSAGVLGGLSFFISDPVTLHGICSAYTISRLHHRVRFACFGQPPSDDVETTANRHPMHNISLNDPRCSLHKTAFPPRSEEHTSELQSRGHLVCRLLL